MSGVQEGGAAMASTIAEQSSESSSARTRRRAATLFESASDTMIRWLKKSSVREFLAEMIGTFILIAVGDGAAASFVLKSHSSPVDTLAITLCWGIGAMIAIIAVGPVSGAHINPAVSVALAVLGNFSWKKIGHYLAAQYLGGFLASAVIYLNFYEAVGHFDAGHRSAFSANATAGIWATYPAPFVSITGALIDQVVGTALLMFAVLAIGDPKGSKIPNWLQPLYLGLTICGLCTAYGLNCMAVLNPARDFAPRIFTAISGWGWEPFQPLGGHYWWIGGIVGPHLGAILGGWIYLLTIDHESLHTASVNETTNEKAGEQPLRNLSKGRDNPLVVSDKDMA